MSCTAILSNAKLNLLCFSEEESVDETISFQLACTNCKPYSSMAYCSNFQNWGSLSGNSEMLALFAVAGETKQCPQPV